MKRKIIETLPDGTKNVYETLTDCAKNIGVADATLCHYLNEKRKNKTNKNKYEYGDIVVSSCNSKKRKSIDTLCWDCQNAIGKCSWSREFKPVEGWTAIPTFIGRDKIKSFCVVECPQFKEDKQ